MDPGSGTVVEFGAGTELGKDVLLDTLHRPLCWWLSRPRTCARSCFARLSARGDADRVTVFPGRATQLPLTRTVVAAAGMHMIGHLTPVERRAMFSALMPQPVPGALVVFNVQPPDTVVEVPETRPFRVTVGRLRYEGQGRAVPTGPDRLRWTMTYRTLECDTENARPVAEYYWWTASAATLAAELTKPGRPRCTSTMTS